MKAKTTRRALLSSAVALILCFAMLAGTTFAWFTDSATSSNNKIQSGTLKVDLEVLEEDNQTWTSIKDSKAAIFTYDKWEPGFTQVKILRVVNEGTLALKWKAQLVSSAPLGELANVIDVYVKEDVTSYPTDLTGWTKLPGTLADFVANIETTTTGNIAAKAEGATEYPSEILGIAFKMQESAGNDYQDKTLGAFDLRIQAAQLNKEEDSFGSSYDILAEYEEPDNTPTLTVMSAADLKAAFNPTISSDSAVINIAADIQLAAGEVWTPLDIDPYISGTVKKVVINGNGHTISGLNAPLCGDSHFGGTSIEINDLTLKNSQIQNQVYNVGTGAFVAYADTCDSIILTNCHLIDSAVSADPAATGVGGLVGYSSSDLTITDCSVINCTITGADESAGAIAGHISAGGSVTTITNAKVVDCTVKGETAQKSGYVVGTANDGTTVITTSAECANNTVFDIANSIAIYGRLSGGTLTINGTAQ